jgi:hypothetical protein
MQRKGAEVIINIHIWMFDLQIRLRWREQMPVKVIAVPTSEDAKMVQDLVNVL